MLRFAVNERDSYEPKLASVNSQWSYTVFTGDSGQKTKEFVTGSKYYGYWDKSIHRMTGYGVYKYPDGSTYRGYFKNGHFNGHGTVYLVQPYNMIFSGTFENGELLKIDQMKFADNIEVDANVTNDKVNFSKWTYCTKLDRRFAIEHIDGIPPVGPTTHLTPGKSFQLDNGEYDAIEGVFKEKTGLLLKRPPPFPSFTFADCDMYNWIREKCRVASHAKIPINPEICSQIIKTNREAEIELEEYPSLCNYYTKHEYFGKLQRKELDVSDKAIDNNSSEFKDDSSISSVEKDVLEIICTAQEYGNRMFGRNLEF